MLTKVKNLLDITSDTMSDLMSMEHKEGSVQLLGFHERGDGGGGVFYWDASKSQSEHNGGTIIAGDAVLGTWDTSGQEAWFTAPSEGTGCWVREYSGAVNVKWFGAKGDGTTDDTKGLQAAIAKYDNVYLPDGKYLISEQLSKDGNLVLTGESRAGARILSKQDITFIFVANATHPIIENLTIASQDADAPWYASHTERHVIFYNCIGWIVRNCNIYGNSATNSGSGLYSSGPTSSMGLLENSVIDHASVILDTWDVHLVDCYIWANSKPVGLSMRGSYGNLRVTGCDFVPPLTTTPGAIASVFLEGAVTQPTFTNCYFDGNFSLSTGTALKAKGGVTGLTINGCLSNGHNDNVFVIDGCISTVIVNNSFNRNNLSGNGKVDILVEKTTAQTNESTLIQGNSFYNTLTGLTTPASAIYVTAASCDRIQIVDNSFFKQNNAYTNPEINLEGGYFSNGAKGTLRGNLGYASKYMMSGSVVVPANTTFINLSFFSPYPLAYAPRPDQIKVQFSAAVPGWRINTTPLPTVTGAGLGLPSGLPAMTVWYSVEL